MADKLGDDATKMLAGDVLAIQREHVATVRKAYLGLAAEEV